MNEGKSEEAIIAEELRIVSHFKLPEYKSVLLIHNGSFRIQFPRKKPCLWWRFWYWALLGWRWRDL